MRGSIRAFVMAELAQTSPAPATFLGKLTRPRRIPLLLRSPLTVVGLIVITVFLACAIAAPLIAPYPPNQQHLSQRLKPPSPDHWMGTDSLGRDQFSRISYGAQVSLTIGLLVVISASLFGTLVWMLARDFG